MTLTTVFKNHRLSFADKKLVKMLVASAWALPELTMMISMMMVMMTIKNVDNVFKAIHLFLHGLSYHPCRLQGNLEGGLHAFIDDYEEEEEDNSENT